METDSDTRLFQTSDYSSDMRVAELKIGNLYKIKERGVSVHRFVMPGPHVDVRVVQILASHPTSPNRPNPRATGSAWREGKKLQGLPAIYIGSFRKKFRATSVVPEVGKYDIKCHKFLIGGEEIHIYGEYIRHIVPYVSRDY